MKKNRSLGKKKEDLTTKDEGRLDGAARNSAQEKEAGESPENLLQELRVHKIELELQNEELLGVKDELESSIKKYDDFYEFAPIAYCAFDRKGMILEASLTTTTILNVPRSLLVGRYFSEYLTRDSIDSFKTLLAKVFSDNAKASCQLRLRKVDESRLSAFVQCSAPVTANKCLAVISDISEIIRLEEQKHLSEEKFRIISTSTPDHIIMQDKELRYLWVLNPQLGLSADEMIGKTDFEIIEREDAQKLSILKRRVIQTGIRENFSTSITDRNGVTNYFEGSYLPFRDSKDNIEGLIGYVRNVTERVSVANELSQTKNYLEQLINFANAPIIVWNPASEIVLFNKAFERLTGYEAAEVTGERLDLLLPNESLGKSRDKIRQTLEGDFWESIEIPILCKNGEIKIVLWNSANIYENGGRTLISTIAQGNDITQRKQAETELRESRRKLELALEKGNIGIWEYDIERDNLSLDNRMKEMLGIPHGDFDGSLRSFERFIMDEDLAQLRESFRRTIEKGRSFETVIRINSRRRLKKYLTLKGKRYREENESLKLIGVGIDITEMQRGAEKAMFKINAELARSNKELEQFAYVASHDLQEPLRMVSSFTQLLAQKYNDKLDKDAHEYIGFAVDGSKRMYDLINGLLAYSRVNSKGKEFESTDLNSVLDEVKRNLRIKIETTGAIIEKTGLPVIQADGNQMLQLFQNLVSNGIKFSSGPPRITIGSKEYTNHWVFSVRDEGIGIDPQYFERIFQIFQRLLPREEYEGTGIGLAICRRIVERHGGHIWVESQPGKGSIFWFSIRKDLTD